VKQVNNIMMGVACLSMAACSSTNVATKNTAPPGTVDVASYEYKASAVKDNVEVIPKWFTELPSNDKAIYAVGTSVTPDLQLSVDMAVLNAKTTLADRINGRVRSQTKNFISKIGSDETDTAILSELEKTTSNLVADVDVAGYKVSESKIVSSGTQYRAFVLLEYSDLQASKILMNRLRKDRMLLSKISSTNAFKELDDKVNEANAQVTAENEAVVKVLTQ
jgi:hypothetical protein